MHFPHVRPPRSHWQHYLTRKVLILAGLVVVTYFVEQQMHTSVINHVHELTLGTLFEHVLFGIPFEE